MTACECARSAGAETGRPIRPRRRSPTVSAWPNPPSASSATTSASKRPAVVNIGMLGSVTDEVSEAWAELIDADRSLRRLLGGRAARGARAALPHRPRRARRRERGRGRRHRGGGALHPPASGPPHPAHAEPSSTSSPTSRSRSPSSSRPSGPSTGASGTAPPIDACRFEIDAPTARFRHPATGSIELVDPTDAAPGTSRPPTRRAGPAPRAPSAGTRWCWDRIAGSAAGRDRPFDAGVQRGALWRDDDGAVQGAVAYKVDDSWTRNRPTGHAPRCGLLVGATPEAERELWRHLCEIDWVQTVSAGNRGIDDPLPLLLEDGRAAVALDHFDCIWARILDVPAALGGSPGRAGRPGGGRGHRRPRASPTGRWQHRPRARRGRGHADHGDR